MRYDEARPLIRSGDLIAFRGEGWLSRLIRSLSGGSWSHVGIAWVFRGRVFLLEAREGRGVGIRALSEVGAFDWIGINGNWSEAVEALALELLGREYAYADAVLVGLGLAPRAHGEICSEYAGRIVDVVRAKWQIPKGLSPAALVECALDNGASLVHVLRQP